MRCRRRGRDGFHSEGEERAVGGVDGGADAKELVADDLAESGEQLTLELLVEMKDGRLGREKGQKGR